MTVPAQPLTRRRLLQSAGAFALAPPPVPARQFNISSQLLDEVERRSCQYFLEQSNPATGLVVDRANCDGYGRAKIASIAATGFGLSAMCIADANGYLPRGAARRRVRAALQYLADRAPHHRGFYYHFLHVESGERELSSELSSVDTAWLLCGVLHAREHFSTPEFDRLAGEILARVDWRWMLDGDSTLRHGWTPERGFLSCRWDRYCELLAMYLIAMGAQEYGIPPSCWHAWQRPLTTESGRPYIESDAPLFVHQYSHAWLDFRATRDSYADYFENSRLATMRHRRFCLGMRSRFPWFDDNMWGITASESRFGYIDWGGPRTSANERIDGTLVPCAAGGSLTFAPDECIAVLTAMVERYGRKVWRRYGFVDAFNPHADWWAPDALGIDVGITLLMAANLRRQEVWSDTMRAPEVQRGFAAAGFNSHASPVA